VTGVNIRLRLFLVHSPKKIRRLPKTYGEMNKVLYFCIVVK
jgi:hypothetical protein